MSQQLVRAPRPMQQSQMGCMVFGYVSRSDSMEYFDKSIKEFQEDGIIPNLDEEVEYTIYRWKAGFGLHESVVLGFQDKFFTIEIQVINSKLVLYTTAKNINVAKLRECGNAVATGLKLIGKAMKVYNNMNKYNFAYNNCQNFVNLYLKEIEMTDQTEDTDFQSLVKTASATAIIGGLACLGISWWNSQRKQ